MSTDLALAPLQGQTPRGGYIHDYDDLDEARVKADKLKADWDRVYLFKRNSRGRLERIEHFQKPIAADGVAQKYVGNKRLRL